MITWILFVLSLIASSSSQYWQKRAALLFDAQPNLTLWQKLFCKPLLLGILFLGLSALTWLGVLSQWDVSVAYPLLSVNFIIMLFIAHHYFDEKIYSNQIIGVLFIIFGVITLGVSA